MTTNSWPDTDGDVEELLLASIQEGHAGVDLTGDRKTVSASEMEGWGADRSIRGSFLRQLLERVHEDEPGTPVTVKGVAITGALDVSGGHLPPLALTQCRLDQVDATGATFTGRARFRGANFRSDANFSDATFARTAEFKGATFASIAEFGDAIFANIAEFDRATFASTAGFGRATFASPADFIGATFTRDAEFSLATFASTAGFIGATFAADAWFLGATFARDAWFNSAMFSDATFARDARFDSAVAEFYNFRGAAFEGVQVGPFVAEEVDLRGTTLRARVRVTIAALTVDASRLQVPAGAHLVLRAMSVNLSDAEFLRPSIVTQADPDDRDLVVARVSPAPLTEQEQDDPLEVEAHVAQVAAHNSAQQVLTKVSRSALPRTYVTSLERASIADLAITGVSLEHCRFRGAHGLAKIRLDTQLLARRRRTFRREYQVLAEETAWRHAGGEWLERGPFRTLIKRAATAPAPADRSGQALEIAGLYRALRKSQEDANDSPGATDFYYGEMEMRRLAAHKTGRHPYTRPLRWLQNRLRLLDLYRTASGYGTQALSPLTSLTVLLLLSWGLFCLPAFAHVREPAQQICSIDTKSGAVRYGPPPNNAAAPSCSPSATPSATPPATPPAPRRTGGSAARPPAVPSVRTSSPAPANTAAGRQGVGTAAEFTARESLTVTRLTGEPPLLETTGLGTALDLLLRLLAPAFLGLAVLGLRSRVKR